MIPVLYGEAGVPFLIKGYAQDFGDGVAEVQFSCDNGQTWTRFPIENADKDANVNWSFEFTPPCAGDYDLLVRAARADGTASPEPAHVHMKVASARF